ncbi:MAG: 30S ribosomal protein S6 [Gemmatimonadetes bacterium]|nr:30S ribosomal protein S6 [Gemmatimonadota bacterium]
MTRRYEIVYIFNSAVEEAQVDQTLERFHALLKSEENPEPIRNVNHWGKRTLAYSIGNNEIGYYVVTQFATDPTLLPEFERLIKLEESVIRYQIVLNEGEVPVPAPLPDTSDGEKPSDRGPSKPDADPSKGGGPKDEEGTNEEN